MRCKGRPSSECRGGWPTEPMRLLVFARVVAELPAELGAAWFQDDSRRRCRLWARSQLTGSKMRRVAALEALAALARCGSLLARSRRSSLGVWRLLAALYWPPVADAPSEEAWPGRSTALIPVRETLASL